MQPLVLLPQPLPLGHPVAHPRLGEDVGGVVRVIAQLAAELTYDGAHGPHVAAALLAPDPFQQMLIGQQPDMARNQLAPQGGPSPG